VQRFKLLSISVLGLVEREDRDFGWGRRLQMLSGPAGPADPFRVVETCHSMYWRGLVSIIPFTAFTTFTVPGNDGSFAFGSGTRLPG